MKKPASSIQLILNYLISAEETLLLKDKQELKSSPKGTLITRKLNNKDYYYNRVSNTEFGITKDLDLIYGLARKSYLLKSIKNHETNIHQLTKCLKHTSSKISSKQPTNLQLDISLSAKENLWLNAMTSQNPYKADHLIYKTTAGILVRSKSEKIIADRLFKHGILFKYESPMTIEDKTVFPDFSILRNDGKIVIWEHNGLMKNDEYFFKAVNKIRQYNSVGFYQHDNLICTEERDILDEERLDQIIFRFILI